MNHMEMVEKLREKADITIEEAKLVLEKNNWDMLDALIELERQGKVSDTVKVSTERLENGAYETVSPTVTGNAFEHGAGGEKKGAGNRGQMRRKIRRIFRMSIDNRFVIKRNEEVLMQVPVLVPILCTMTAFWITGTVLIAGLFFNLKYSFEGKELGTDKINETMEKASEYAQNFADELK